MKRFFKYVYRLAQNIAKIWIDFRRNKIVINSLIKNNIFNQYDKTINWGDNLNYYFIKSITKKNIINYYSSIISRAFNKTNYLCIGSTINWCVNKNTIIWGGGVMSDKFEMKCKPKLVTAVRGKLTRKYLLNKGVACPEIYGDPALLLPYCYKPISAKKYQIGIIPHYVDNNNKYIIDFFSKYKTAKFIDMKNYKDWHDIIDSICECDFILSSSLHGLIVSDAYDVPNYWVKFSNKIIGDDFKFLDYYSSVNNPISQPYVIDSNIDIEDVLQLKDKWRRPQIDLAKLIKACPFNIKLDLYQ